MLHGTDTTLEAVHVNASGAQAISTTPGSPVAYSTNSASLSFGESCPALRSECPAPSLPSDGYWTNLKSQLQKIPVAPSCIYQIAGLRCIYGRFDTEFFPSMVPVASLGWFTTSGRGTAQPCLFSFIVLFDFSVTAISDFCE